MDWDLKAPASWDLAELEHDVSAAATTPAAAAPGPSSGVHHVNCRVPAGNGGGRAECSVDLKLGGLGGCELGHGGAALAADRRSGEPAAAGKDAASAPASSSSTGVAAGAGPNRRPRPAGGGQQCPSCAVDGCKADLSKCRDYHRRHKVCEAHSKTPVVVVAGREMRFCQQCSRFHLLAEFDETKRSCRKRLDGHNRRRRKPQPDPMTTASFITSQQGTRFSPFTITTPRPDATWPGIIKTEESPYYTPQILQEGTSNRQHFGVGSTSAYAKEGRRFPFLQEGEISFASGVVLEAASAVCQPLLKTVAAPPESGGGGGSKVFSDGLTRVLDSDCALSLLSAPASSSGIDMSRMVRPTEQVPPVAQQPLVSGLQFGSLPSWFSRPLQAAAAATAATGMESEQQLNTVLGGASDGEMNYNGMFHVGGEGSSDGTSSSLPFSWQ